MRKSTGRYSTGRGKNTQKQRESEQQKPSYPPECGHDRSTFKSLGLNALRTLSIVFCPTCGKLGVIPYPEKEKPLECDEAPEECRGGSAPENMEAERAGQASG